MPDYHCVLHEKCFVCVFSYLPPRRRGNVHSRWGVSILHEARRYSELFFFPICFSVAFKYERSSEEAADERLINEVAFPDVYFTRNRRVALSRISLNARFSALDHADHISLKCRVFNAVRQCKIYAAASDPCFLSFSRFFPLEQLLPG